MYTILNDPAAGTNAATHEAQARPDKGDTDIWAGAWSGTGVVSGCAVTQRAAGANMSVDVASGSISLAGVAAAVSGTNLAIGAAHATYDRIDLVTATTGGTLAV